MLHLRAYLIYHIESMPLNPKSICDVIHVSVDHLLLDEQLRIFIIDISKVFISRGLKRDFESWILEKNILQISTFWLLQFQ